MACGCGGKGMRLWREKSVGLCWKRLWVMAEMAWGYGDKGRGNGVKRAWSYGRKGRSYCGLCLRVFLDVCAHVVLGCGSACFVCVCVRRWIVRVRNVFGLVRAKERRGVIIYVCPHAHAHAYVRAYCYHACACERLYSVRVRVVRGCARVEMTSCGL